MNLAARVQKLSENAHQILSSKLSNNDWSQTSAELLNQHFKDFKVSPALVLEESLNRELVSGATFPSLGFSHHPMTLYAGPLFNVDLYFWLPSDTLPHDHGFHGAFMPLFGDYAQTLFSFHTESDLGEGVFKGRLSEEKSGLLENNKAHTTLHAPDFIHAVLHESFCVTLVLRSKNSGEPLSDYTPYFKIKNLVEQSQQAQEDWQRLELLTHLESQGVKLHLEHASSARLIRWLHQNESPSRLRSEVLQALCRRSDFKDTIA